VIDPYNEEEKAYLFNSECGFPGPYNPKTSADDLASLRPAVISSPMGVQDTVAYKLHVASGQMSGEYRHASVHLGRIHRGNGLAFFESKEQKDIAQKFKRQDEVLLEGPLAEKFGKKKIVGLDGKDKEVLMGAWVAGKYKKPEVPGKSSDVLGLVGAFLKRNETYLPEDARKLEGKIKSLLPVVTSKAGPAKARAAV
jgi:hypothetical protein